MLERLLIVLVVAAVAAIVVLAVRALVAHRTAGRLGAELGLPLPAGSADGPTVLYFYGPGCAACASQRRALDLLGERRRLNVVPVDAAREPALASWAGVMTVPTTAIVDRRRRLRAVNHGFRPADDLAAQLDQAAV